MHGGDRIGEPHQRDTGLARTLVFYDASTESERLSVRSRVSHLNVFM